ncbi:hypothetical protein BDEG_25668 [Batrachochytrium dendrobatidis JEL423]|nr:hypothetical protein BDEG_25668 [Batrachochytrium dendrobatidis JEL423]
MPERLVDMVTCCIAGIATTVLFFDVFAKHQAGFLDGCFKQAQTDTRSVVHLLRKHSSRFERQLIGAHDVVSSVVDNRKHTVHHNPVFGILCKCYHPQEKRSLLVFAWHHPA